MLAWVRGDCVQGGFALIQYLQRTEWLSKTDVHESESKVGTDVITLHGADQEDTTEKRWSS